MDRRDPAQRNAAAAPCVRMEAADDLWLDRALEDSFPASDPVASNLFD
jgi:hypothetical protein